MIAGDPPTIVTQPDSEFTAFAGSAVNFTVTATGTALTYQWQRNETDLVDTPSELSGTTTFQLSVLNVQESDEGSYQCVISNGNTPASDATSDPIQLIVCKYAYYIIIRVRVYLCAPVNMYIFFLLHTVYTVEITMDPVSLSDVIPGSQVMFSVTASADPAGGTITYQWRVNGTDIMDDAKFSGATTDTLTISNVQESDQGNYYCNVSNDDDDTSSSTVTLDVRKF